MTVNELIARLQLLPEDSKKAPVIVVGQWKEVVEIEDSPDYLVVVLKS